MPPNAYNISDALLGLGEKQLRSKGEQRGSVVRKGDSWHILYREWRKTPDGNLAYQQVSRKVGSASGADRLTFKQAQQLGYEEHVLPANAPANCPQGLATVQQFVELRFIPDHVQTLKTNGQSFYGSMLKHVLGAFGNIRMTDLNPGMVQVLLASKAKSGLSIQTVKHIRNTVSAIYRHAKLLRFYRGDLPTEGVALPGPLVHEERLALTWPQVEQLAEAIAPQYQPLVVFLAQTGLRIGEARGMRWQSVNLTDDWKPCGRHTLPPNSILVAGNFTRSEYTTPKSRSGYRQIPLTSSSWVALMEQWEASKFRDAADPVFAARNGRPISDNNLLKRFLKPAAELIGLPWVTWHSLRHTNSTLADQAGLTPAEKRKLLGHASEEMGMRYTHPEMDHVRAALERMEAVGGVQ